MARPAPDYPRELPELRKRFTIEEFDFGHETHVVELYRTDRRDCYRVMVDNRLWKRRIGMSRILAGLRKAMPRVESGQ